MLGPNSEGKRILHSDMICLAEANISLWFWILAAGWQPWLRFEINLFCWLVQNCSSSCLMNMLASSSGVSWLAMSSVSMATSVLASLYLIHLMLCFNSLWGQVMRLLLWFLAIFCNPWRSVRGTTMVFSGVSMIGGLLANLWRRTEYPAGGRLTGVLTLMISGVTSTIGRGFEILLRKASTLMGLERSTGWAGPWSLLGVVRLLGSA